MKCTESNSINELESQISDSCSDVELGNSRTDSSLLSSSENCSDCNNQITIVNNEDNRVNNELEQCREKLLKKSKSKKWGKFSIR